MYIIWKYDQFPYKLCGEVLSKSENGLYCVKGYGGMSFEAMRVIRSDEKGKQVEEALRWVTEHKRQKQFKLDMAMDSLISERLVSILGL